MSINNHELQYTLQALGYYEDGKYYKTKDCLNAAKDLLDRVGLVKTEKVQVETTNGLMILPPKAVEQEDVDEN